MRYQLPEQLHADRRLPVIVQAESLPWTPSPQLGVERRFLEREGSEVARATSIVRYAPASHFPEHSHELGEEYFVLSGVFSDQHGDFPSGSYVRNPPGSRHAPFTREGCVIFVKLRQMIDTGQQACEKRAPEIQFAQTAVDGLSRAPLFDLHGVESVGIERLDAGASWDQRQADGGEEILVLDGSLNYGATECPPLTWLRIPQRQVQPLSAPRGCRFWVKRGHLPT